MSKIFLFTGKGGSLCVVHPAPGVPDNEVIAASIPVSVTRKALISKGVEAPFEVLAGDYIERRVAELNGVNFKEIAFTESDSDALPVDRIFRASWQGTDGGEIIENAEAAKIIAHEIRRQTRDGEFEPLDKQVTIVFADTEKLAEVESQRQAIRDKYAALQIELDACTCADELREKLFQMAPALAQ